MIKSVSDSPLRIGYICSPAEIQQIKDDLSAHIRALNRRCDIYNYRYLERIKYILQLFIEGEYRHFSGWKSAIKDLFRS